MTTHRMNYQEFKTEADRLLTETSLEITVEELTPYFEQGYTPQGAITKLLEDRERGNVIPMFE